MERITLKELLKLNKKDLIGKVIVFPTDTVYGVGCLYLDSIGRNKIFEMKKRDHLKLLPILAPSITSVKQIAKVDNKYDKYLKLWPGALTLIFESTDKNYINDTIAIRIPDSNIALDILNHFGMMEVTSVNTSGEKEINDVFEIETKFSDFVDYVVTDKAEFSKISSTVVSLVNNDIKILRQGTIIIK